MGPAERRTSRGRGRRPAARRPGVPQPPPPDTPLLPHAFALLHPARLPSPLTPPLPPAAPGQQQAAAASGGDEEAEAREELPLLRDQLSACLCALAELLLNEEAESEEADQEGGVRQATADEVEAVRGRGRVRLCGLRRGRASVTITLVCYGEFCRAPLAGALRSPQVDS